MDEQMTARIRDMIRQYEKRDTLMVSPFLDLASAREAEAMAKAREILIRHFGGYTIQEAHGGWIGDDETEYQEYTLVIYLSDTTSEEVHAAADELVETFNQNTVLIQCNPTQTEFYAGANAQ